MSMLVHPAQQGSPEWLAERAGRYNAGDAAAMLGCDPNGRSRTNLLDSLVKGFVPEVGNFKQRLYDKGHEVEELCRPLAEGMVGEDLYPLVGSIEVPGLSRRVGASFDGLTMARDTNFECKSLNDSLAAALPREDDPDANDAAALHKGYRVQMEQQLLVSGAERVLFCAAAFHPSGATQSLRACWYRSDPALRQEILAGWRQLEADLATHTPAEVVATATATPVESLPAVLVKMSGALSVESNLDAFALALRAFIDKIPENPSTDQQFADTEAACKALKRAEDALEAEDARALNGMADVATVRRVMADLKELARSTRLQREKLVKARKEQLRTEQVQRGRAALASHLQGLNQRLGGGFMPDIAADFGAVISGLKSLDSIRDRIDTELARAKIAANEIADRIQANLKAIDAAGKPGLFPDRAALALKACDDCAAVIAARLAAEEKRMEGERENIRRQEAERLEREAERQSAAAAKAALPSTPAPIASPVSVNAATAANSANVLPLRSPASPPTLKLGDINARLQHVATNEAGLAALGFPAAKVKGACLYHESQFSQMCDSLVAHLRMVAQRELEAA
jgi:predicted phage-related endonuclease